MDDSRHDAELIQQYLRSHDLAFESKRVDTQPALEKALQTGSWDVVLLDFNLPRLDAHAALRFLHQESPHLPVILVTGTISEELAIELLQEGADDFLFKGNLKRLRPAIVNAIHKKFMQQEKRKSEQALEESEERFRLLFDAVRDYALFMLDPQGHVMIWNHGAELLSGYRTDEVLGQHCSFFYPMETQSSAEKELKVAAAQGRFEGTGQLRRKDGSTFWVHTVVTPVRRSGGELRAFAKIMHDITARLEAEEHLKQSQEQMRALAGKIQSAQEAERARLARELHDEFSQVLTAMHLDLSSIVTKLASEQNPLGSKLKKSVARLRALRGGVLRLASELRPPILDRLGLIPAIGWQLRGFQARTRIETRFACEMEEVDFSPEISTAMFRILQEALSNVQHHAEASCVRVALRKQSAALAMEIKDDGRGIQASEITNVRSLGLLGMKERAILLGGTFRVEGVPGKGTTVQVTLSLNPTA